MNRYGAAGAHAYDGSVVARFLDTLIVPGTPQRPALLAGTQLRSKDARAIRRWRGGARASQSTVRAILDNYGIKHEWLTVWAAHNDLPLWYGG